MTEVQPIPKKKASKAPTAKSLKNKATEMHSQYVRARDRRCVRCGSTRDLQCMHVISRSWSATRTDETNGHTGCATCHWFLTNNPHEHVDFFRAYLGADVFQGLVDKAYDGRNRKFGAPFWRNEVERLRELLRGVS